MSIRETTGGKHGYRGEGKLIFEGEELIEIGGGHTQAARLNFSPAISTSFFR